jgi:hypothetical protein
MGKGDIAMKNNEATWDRAIRIALGIVLLSLTFVGPHTLWGLVGFVPLLTGLLGFCPLYRIVGLSTCRSGARREAPTA